MIRKINYLKNINFLNNIPIYEYDISKANINILFYKNIISEKEYNRLYNADRMERQKTIGIMELKDRSIYTTLSEGILEMRKLFLEENNICDDDILACKNDAVFLIDKIPQKTKFYNIEFVLKNTYTSYYKANNMEFYYYHDNINNIEKLDIKGIKDDKLKYHENYMCDFIKALFDMIDYNINDAVLMTRSFYNQFMSNNLDIGYYRNFDSESLFRLNVYNNIYDTESASINDLIYINKDCNLNLIRDLWQIVTYIQLNKRR